MVGFLLIFDWVQQWKFIWLWTKALLNQLNIGIPVSSEGRDYDCSCTGAGIQHSLRRSGQYNLSLVIQGFNFAKISLSLKLSLFAMTKRPLSQFHLMTILLPRPLSQAWMALVSLTLSELLHHATEVRWPLCFNCNM